MSEPERAFVLCDGHVIAGIGVADGRFAIFIAARPPHDCGCCPNPDFPGCGDTKPQMPRPHRLAGSVETLADVLARPEAFIEIGPQMRAEKSKGDHSVNPLILAVGDRLRLVYPE